jgi:signal transduction histidine kinase/putative methionine-R-sulfoxide reductase with GAF domain
VSLSVRLARHPELGTLVEGLVEDISRRVQATEALHEQTRRHATELERQVEELSVLHAIATAGAEATSQDALIERATQVVGETLYPDNFGIVLLDESGQWMTPHHSYRGSMTAQARQVPVPTERGISGRTARTGIAQRVSDVSRDPDYFAVTSGMRSELCVPLRLGDRVIGVINAESAEPDAFTEADERVLGIVAGQLATAIEKLRLFEETSRRAAEMEALAAFSSSLRVARTVDEMMPLVVAKTAETLGAQSGGLLLLTNDDAGERLVVEATCGYAVGSEGTTYAAAKGLIWDLVHHGEPLAITAAQLAEDDAPHPVLDDLIGDLDAVLCAPLRTHEGPAGLLFAARAGPQPPTAEELRLIAAISDITANALRRATLYEQTERHAAELEVRVAERTAELQAANQQLRALDRLKSQFVSNVSHELRTPLANIKMYLALLDRGRPEKAERYMATLRREADRLHVLIEDLLHLSRLDLGTAQPVRRPLAVNGIVRALVDDRAALVGEHGLELHCRVTPDLPLVHADEKMVVQVLTNLMSNAMHYTPPGGSIVVATAAAEDGGRAWVTLAVQDTGPGIAAEDRPHLFQRFYRGEAARNSKEPGTGLGLAICKEIVDRHEGRITLDTAPGRGTRFTVWLPAVNGKAPGADD